MTKDTMIISKKFGWRIKAGVALVIFSIALFACFLVFGNAGARSTIKTDHTLTLTIVELSSADIDAIRNRIAVDNLLSLSPFWQSEAFRDTLAEVRDGVKNVDVSSKSLSFTFEWTPPPPPSLREQILWKYFFGKKPLPGASPPRGEMVYASEVALVLALQLLETTTGDSAKRFREAMALLSKLDVFDGALLSRLTEKVAALRPSLNQDQWTLVPDWLREMITGQQGPPAGTGKPSR